MCEKNISIEAVEKFLDYLRTSDVPEHWLNRILRKLPSKQAFEIIYYLQEELHLIPESYEMCQGCERLFDSEASGTSVDCTTRIKDKPVPKKYHGNWCDDCFPPNFTKYNEATDL